MSVSDFPALLTPGLHPMTLIDLRQLCVDQFGRSKRRPIIFQGLNDFFTMLSQSRISGTAWIDGSFLTHKPEPNDCDLVVAMDGARFEVSAPEVQIAVERCFDTAKAWVKKTYHCDAYLRFEYPALHLVHASGLQARTYWQNHFGRDRSANPKGIAVVELVVAP
jgi:hypothetical protein